MPAVRREYRVGVISSVSLHFRGLAALDVVEIYAAVGAEGVLLAGFLAAAVGYVHSVSRPVELLYAAERLSWKLVWLISEQIHAALWRDGASHCCKVGARSFCNPVVPVTVHKVIGGISLGFVKSRVAVLRALYRSRYSAGIDDVASVRRELEFADSGRNVAKLPSCSELLPAVCCLPELAVQKEIYALSVRGPPGVGYALGVPGELDFVAAVRVDGKEVAAAAVLLYGCVADAVKDTAAVRG